MLGGSLSDQFYEGTHFPKPHATLGFPISIAPDMGRETENAVAEVEVTVLNGPTPTPIAPSVITLLPREKTYNVASLADKSVSLGAGVVVGMITGGANFFWSHKTYYLVKDQDTVALQREPRKATNLATGARAYMSGLQRHTRRYYWVLAYFGDDPSPTAYGPISISDSVKKLDDLNYVRIDFPRIPGATAYDLLTSDRPEFPAPCEQCAVATNIEPATNPKSGMVSIFDKGQAGGHSDGQAPLTTTFAWQFKPVLGQKKVMPGLRQAFVQLVLPVSREVSCPGSVQIVTRWREFNAKTATAGRVLRQSEPQEYPIPNFDLSPEPQWVETEDLGNGNIRVTVRGGFGGSTRITIGGTTLNSSAFELTDRYLRFTASAQLLATNKAFLISEDGIEREILEPDPIPIDEDRMVGVPPCMSLPLAPPRLLPPSRYEKESEAENGFLFNSVPSGARVVVDQNPALACSPTPCRMKLVDGKHTARAEIVELRSPDVPFETVAGQRRGAVVLEIGPQIRLRSAEILPFSDKASEVRLTLDRVPQDLQNDEDLNAGRRLAIKPNPLLVTIGNQTFGLRDQPIEISRVLVPCDPADRKECVKNWLIRLIVPTATLAQAHLITVQRLFWGLLYKQSVDVKEQLDAHSDSEFSISRLDLLSTGDPDKPASVNVFSVTGSHLDGVTIVSPDGIAPIATIPGTGSQATIGLIRLTGTQMKGLKQLVLRKQDGTVAILALPDDAKPKAAKPSITTHAAIDIGATSIDLSGALLDQVTSIAYLKTQFTYRLTPDKSKLLVDLPALFTAAAGIRILDLTFTDGSTARYPVEVAAKKQ